MPCPDFGSTCALLGDVLRAKVPPDLPAEFAGEREVSRLYHELLELRHVIAAMAGGGLSANVGSKGYTAGALKTLQANLKHMTWQTQMIADGDYSQRLDFLGDFSKAFNAMASQLEESQRTIRESRENLTRINAGLELEIEQRKRAQAALAESEAHYRNLTETMKDVVWILDTDTLRFTYVSPSVERLRGFTPEEIMAHPLDAALTPREAITLKQTIRANRQDFLAGMIDETMYFTSEVEQTHKDGSPIWTEAIVRYVRNEKTGAVELHGVIRDISDRRALRLELERQATTDSLTGIANRRHFLSLGQKEINRCARHGCAICLLMLDIDHFKKVNDTFGHATGDLAIQAVAKACGSELRDSDLLGRLGGEEFAILLVETDLQRAYGVAERLRTLVHDIRLFTKDRHRVRLTASIGLTERQHGEQDLSEILARADAALYRAKNSGRNRVERWEDSTAKSRESP